ncbi:Probable RNA-directed DNA polymerase from transposon BS [Eumeta japonica]|uniref:Probable RNA-directed DNA polymerase from transposon BS n=1 Tax=Eumeta variegata TaxID=151549 RepID=A0A4C1ZLG2_EUMVA|nr:Probable RNA-directed DNA polymerase from transposon BS [Eumeta japonica]
MALLVAIFNACFKNCYFPPIWKEAVVIGLPKPRKPRDLPASYRPISLLSGLEKLFEKTIKTRLSEHLVGKGLITNEQFGFRPNHSCPQQVHRSVEHISEDFKKKRKTMAVFFDVAKAFDRHHKYKHLGITLDKHLHFKDHIKRVRQNAQLYLSRPSGMIGKKSKMSLRNKCTLCKVCIRPVMTYAAPVFAHADPKALTQLQILQNNFCRRASGALWYVRNDILHRDLELTTISKYMQDMSKKFFDTAANHPNPLLQSAVSYEPPPHIISSEGHGMFFQTHPTNSPLRAITRRRHPMPIGRDRRSPQSSNLLGLRTTANQQLDSGVFWSVKVGHTPRTRRHDPGATGVTPSAACAHATCLVLIVRGLAVSRLPCCAISLSLSLTSYFIRPLAAERPGPRTGPPPERGLLKDFEDYCSSPASPDSVSEMDIDKQQVLRTTVHYSSGELESDFDSVDSDDSKGEEELFTKVQSRKARARRARLIASGAITPGPGFQCYSPAKSNSGPTSSPAIPVAPSPTPSWRNTGDKKKPEQTTQTVIKPKKAIKPETIVEDDDDSSPPAPRIKVELPHKRSSPGQCHNCQLYGHSSKNCFRKARCVKCLGDHGTAACTRNKETDGAPACVLCNTSGHTANYLGYPRAPKNTRFIPNRNNRDNNSSPNNKTVPCRTPARAVSKNITYANVTAGRRKDPPKSSFRFHTGDCTRLRINYSKAVRTADDGIKIHCPDVETFRNLNKYLVDSKVQFHMHALEEERKLKAVIRGIPTDFPVDEIQADLCGQGFPVYSMHRLCRKGGSPLWLVLAVLPRTEEAKNIFNNLNRVCGLSDIRVEAPHEKGGPGQCHRCQLYGHAAANCHADPRCMKCLVPHWTRKCPRTPESREQPSCINCGQQYTANHRGCPKAPKFISQNRPNPNKPKSSCHRGRSGTIWKSSAASHQCRPPLPRPRAPHRLETTSKRYQSAQNRGIYPIPPLKKPDNSVAIDDAEIAECLADSIEEAEVIGIHKPGKPRDLPASYRPISLLSGLGKLFEKILKTRLSDHLLGKGLIIDEQFGFRPAHSCPQQVLRIVEYVSEGLETERSTVAVFDVSKAFDKVWHAGLIYKLYSLQYQIPIIVIQNYLANRHFTFRHERTHWTRRLIRAGVPQGSTLSPAVLRVHKRYTTTVVVWCPTRVIRGRYRAFTEVGIGAPDSLLPFRGPLMSRSMEVEDRSKPQQISSHTLQVW